MLRIMRPFHKVTDPFFDVLLEEYDIFWHPMFFRALVGVYGELSCGLLHQAGSQWILYGFYFMKAPNGATIAVVPYNYGGYLANHCDLPALTKFDREVRDFLVNEGVSEETIPNVHPFLCPDQYSVSSHHFTGVRMSRLMDCEIPLERQIKPAALRSLRRAERHGLEVQVSKGTEVSMKSLENFCGLYWETMKRVGAGSHFIWSAAAFDRLIRTLGESCQLIEIRHKDQTIASYLCIYTKKFFTFFLAGYNRDSVELRPNNLAYAEMYRTARRLGCQFVHLGGGRSVAMDGLYRFKSQFGLIERVCYSAVRRFNA